MIAFIFLCLIVMFALGTGSLLLRSFRFSFSNILEEVVFSTGLGFGILAYALFVLGVFHGLYISIIFTFLILGVLLSIKPVKRVVIDFYQICRAVRMCEKSFFVLLLGVLVTVLALSLIKCFVPPIGNDPLVYHLDLPKRFLKYHDVHYFPYTANSTFPLLMEMLYVLGLALKGPVLAQMLHWSTGVLSGLVIFSIARKTLRFEYAFLSATIFLTIPGVFHQMPTANNDVALSLYFVLQIFAIWKWFQNFEFRWLALAGIFAGFGLSVKLIAVLGIVSSVFVVLIFGGPKKFKKSFVGLLIFSVFTIFVSFVWYLRSYLLTGNPIFPFFPNLFGNVGHTYAVGKHGLGKTLIDFLLAPWNMIVRPASFGGIGNQLGPLFLLVLPSILLIKKQSSKLLAFLLLYSGIYFILWFLGPQNLRFFFPAATALSIVIAFLFQYISDHCARLFKWGVFLILWISFVFNLLIAVYYLRADYRVAFGLEKKEVFLKRSERSFVIANFINKTLPANTEILSQEVRTYYFDPDMSAAILFRQRKGMSENLSFSALSSSLKKNGIFYLLLVEPQYRKSNMITYDSYLAEEVKVINFTDSSGKCFQYKLLRLK